MGSVVLWRWAFTQDGGTVQTNRADRDQYAGGFIDDSLLFFYLYECFFKSVILYAKYNSKIITNSIYVCAVNSTNAVNSTVKSVNCLIISIL